MKSILLIDDDPGISDLIVKMLNNSDYEVHVVETEAAAIDMINGPTEFDVAVVDFWLGFEDSTGLLDLLAAKRPNVPSVLISGGDGKFSIESTHAVGQISGAIHFLQKPFRKAELMNVLNSIT
ncbi:response regulator [Yoonia maritima]|uniref:response regulator n=1 Tax=Yoonia maritima TaxID=1435347 RepID=UPI0037369E4C